MRPVPQAAVRPTPSVLRHGFSPAELLLAVGACSAIRFGADPPPWLREFLAVRLERRNPALAGRVRRLGAEPAADLFRYIGQALRSLN